MVWVIRVFGFVITMLGFLFTITVIGALLGIPMMLVGSIMVIATFFGSRKMTINNVVQFANGPLPQTPASPSTPAQTVIATEPARPAIEQPKQVAQQLLAAKFCTKCGAAIANAESSFCDQCGSKL